MKVRHFILDNWFEYGHKGSYIRKIINKLCDFKIDGKPYPYSDEDDDENVIIDFNYNKELVDLAVFFYITIPENHPHIKEFTDSFITEIVEDNDDFPDYDPSVIGTENNGKLINEELKDENSSN